jgi:capsular polysaccharide biosynthesis protein
MSPPLLRRPVGRFGLLLSLTLIGGSAGLTYGVKAPPEYTARAYVVTTGDTAVTYAQAYGRIATSGPVLADAAGRLGADASGLSRVTASTSPAAPVIEITARARTAGRAATLANAVAQGLAAYGTARAPTLHSGLTVLAPALVPARRSSPSPVRATLIGTSAGLLAGAVGALLTLRRPPRPDFASPAEIEGHLRVWRAQYGPRSVTAYRGAAALSEPPSWGGGAARPVPPAEDDAVILSELPARDGAPKPALDGPTQPDPPPDGKMRA